MESVHLYRHLERFPYVRWAAELVAATGGFRVLRSDPEVFDAGLRARLRARFGSSVTRMRWVEDGLCMDVLRPGQPGHFEAAVRQVEGCGVGPAIGAVGRKALSVGRGG